VDNETEPSVDPLNLEIASMPFAKVLKEKLVAHGTEIIFTLLAMVVPIYLLLAETWLVPFVMQTSPEWLVRVFAVLVAAVLGLVAWIFYQRPNLRFDEDTGVYVDRKTQLHVCPRCLSEKKHSHLKNESHGFRCTVCSNYFGDPNRKGNEEPQKNLGPHGWMAR
jgi:hypothetical protein